jgi:hypothetical protein
VTVNKIGLTVKSKMSYEQISQDLLKLTDVEVLVGFPEDTTDRPPSEDEPAGITNASLAYIHDQGAPESHIPARPFMIPGMKACQEKVADKLGQLLKAVVNGKGVNVIAQGFTQVGIIASLSIKDTINNGIDPPLAIATLQARARRGRKGAKEELKRREQGLPPSTAFAKPLVDTGELRNAVSYAIRSRKKRK